MHYLPVSRSIIMNWEEKVIKDTCIVGLYHLLLRHLLFRLSLIRQLSPQLSPSVIRKFEFLVVVFLSSAFAVHMKGIICVVFTQSTC